MRTAKPWFCVVISTLLVRRFEHRLVGAAVAELQLERLAAQRQAAAVDGPDRCRISASCPPAGASSRWRSPAAPGRRGRWTGRRRRACAPARRRPWPCPAAPSPCSRPAPGSAGCSASCRNRGRRRGASAAAAAGRSRSGLVKPSDQSNGRGGTTSRTRSRPTMPGRVRALWTSEASSRSAVDRTPFMAPRTRSRRTRARVSIPSMPRTPFSRR